ncbi:MAG: hypothetical protein R3B90_07280 [Planctomycetaceae bacterium]
MSIWLVYHVVGIVLFPASIPVPPEGLLYRVCDLAYSRYMQGAVHGRRTPFLRPSTRRGPAVAGDRHRPDGDTVVETFPRRSIKPRLLYHRYFMLSERSADIYDQDEWFRMYAANLGHFHGGERVRLDRIIHHLPTPDDIRSGLTLDDPRFYEVIELGDWSAEDLAAPFLPADELELPLGESELPSEPISGAENAAEERDDGAELDTEPTVAAPAEPEPTP